MKKNIPLISIIILLTAVSCSTTKNSLRVNEFTTPSSYDEVWTKIVKYFSDKQWKNAELNKDNGYATSPEKISSLVTTLTKTHKLLVPDAYFYVPIVCKPRSKQQTSGKLSGDWNIQVIKKSESLTIIRVNLINIKNSSDIIYCSKIKRRYRAARLKNPTTTGVFENEIYEIIK